MDFLRHTRRFARVFLPGRWRRFLRLRFGWQWFRGSFVDWRDARAASRGYEDLATLARVVSATRKVVAGAALWDRDGVAFDQLPPPDPLVLALQRIAGTNGGRLDVVDFGGALGSTWRQCRPMLANVGPVRWRVVEQAHYVQAGAEFADAVLSFHSSLGDAFEESIPSAVLFSSVLQYLEAPMALLQETIDRKPAHVLVDRTPFSVGDVEELVVQHTPPELGGGSYPCWLFSRKRFLAALAPCYRLVSVWPGHDDVDCRVTFSGFHFARNG